MTTTSADHGGTHGHAHADHRSVAGGSTRAAVFGLSDGLTSNVLLVIGFAGSGVDSSVVRLAGIAGAVAGAVSMAAGEWISVSAQNELVGRELAVERRELKRNHVAEEAELAERYVDHGMEPETAARAAHEVMRDRDRAVLVHAREELGVDPHDLPSPWRAAALSFLCFVAGAFAPVVPWFVAEGTAATAASLVIGLLVAIGLGAAIGALADRSVPRSVLRQVAILLLASTVTYAIGAAVGVSV
jgi:VIT1/CCC1 family predicted Fe2+/Mn2+ transporter